MQSRTCVTLAVLTMSLAVGGEARAQTPAPPAAAPGPVWRTTAGAGLAVTKGNSNTSTFNATYSVDNDPKARNVFKSDGLFIRGTSSGESSANKVGVNVRDQYQLGARGFVFGQTQYLHDEFKDIDYLVAPTSGVGVKVVSTSATNLSLDIGAGGIWEKNPGAGVRASGAITVGQRFSQALSPTSTITQNLNGLWPSSDLGDYLLTLDTTVTAAMSTHTQLKLEWVDTFKNKPPATGVKKNDTSVFVAIVFKN
jgi:putative salt-induced outer membrane protein YdiY